MDGEVGKNSWNALFAKAGTILGTDIYNGDETKSGAFYDDLEKNYWFCFCKSSEGGTVQDARLGEHIGNLEARTILRGAYHFFRFSNPDTDAQIANFLDAAKKGGIVWSDIYNSPADSSDIPNQLLVRGNTFYVAGSSVKGANQRDILVLKYSGQLVDVQTPTESAAQPQTQ